MLLKPLVINMYGEAIINRLHDNCALRDETNPARRVLINTVGAILDDFDLYDSMEAPFLQNASGVYLDLHGRDLGVKRKNQESDEDYRNRLFYEVLGVLTVKYLLEVYDLELYAYVPDFSMSGMKLTSDNPYIRDNGFMSVASDEVKSILENKFIIGGGISWIDNP